MPRLYRFAAAIALILAGCAGVTPSAKAPDAPTQEALEKTRAVAAELTSRLGSRLKAELSTGGPESAIAVCKEAAPDIAAKLSAENKWWVGRVGTRVRNPANTPNAWQQEALDQFSERLAKGEKPDAMEFTRIETVGNRQYLLYAKAIMVQPVCTTCHGSTDAIPDGVKARLKEEYPNDQATGYQVGELRGAIVIRRPL